MDLLKLKDKFNPDEIEFRIGATSKDKTKAIALAYITNRAIQNRLDEVCGAGSWKNEFKEWKGQHQICGISILINGEWVTKWDGAEDSKTEPIKGGLSNSMKRAAAQWGVGRYLYDVPNFWVDILPCGNSYKFKTQPKLPKQFLPEGVKDNGYLADVATDDDFNNIEILPTVKEFITKEMQSELLTLILKYNIDKDKVLKWAKIKKLEDLTESQYKECLGIWKQGIEGFELPKKKIDVSDKEKEKLDKLNKVLGGAK